MNNTCAAFTPGWQSLFEAHGLASFDQLWNTPLSLVDEPNVGRGGRSEVGKLELHDNDKSYIFYIKRQLNYTTKTLAHPFSGISLTRNEFNNITAFKALGIACLDVCYQGDRHHQGELQSILITPELQGYQDLEHYQPASIKESRQITKALANLLSIMHNANYRYNCLYPKHIFINPANSEAPVRLIDLEKVSRSPFKQYNRIKDLSTLQRRSNTNSSCNLYFLLCYFQRNKHDASISQFIQKMDTRRAKRNKG